MENAPKSPQFDQSERPATQSESVESLSDWRAAKEAAPAWVTEQLECVLDEVASLEKCQSMQEKLSECEAFIKDTDQPKAIRRQYFYGAELIAKQLTEDEAVLAEAESATLAERSTMPAEPPAEYGGKFQVVADADKQPLSPAASYMRTT